MTQTEITAEEILNQTHEEYLKYVAEARAHYEQYWQDFFEWGMKEFFGVVVDWQGGLEC